jgi:hypothetical protein
MIWDKGVWAPAADNRLGDEADIDRQLAKGDLKFGITPSNWLYSIRVRLGLHREPLHGGIERRPLRNRPRQHHAPVL